VKSHTSPRCKPIPEEVRQTADLLERRWQLSVLYAALTGALRFNEFDSRSGARRMGWAGRCSLIWVRTNFRTNLSRFGVISWTLILL